MSDSRTPTPSDTGLTNESPTDKATIEATAAVKAALDAYGEACLSHSNTVGARRAA